VKKTLNELWAAKRARKKKERAAQIEKLCREGEHDAALKLARSKL